MGLQYQAIAVIRVVKLSLAETVLIRPILRDTVAVRFRLVVIVIRYPIPFSIMVAINLSPDVVARV